MTSSSWLGYGQEGPHRPDRRHSRREEEQEPAKEAFPPVYNERVLLPDALLPSQLRRVRTLRAPAPSRFEVRADGADDADEEGRGGTEEREHAVKLGDEDRDADAGEREEGPVDGVPKNAGLPRRLDRCEGDRSNRRRGVRDGRIRLRWRRRTVAHAADKGLESLDERLAGDRVLYERIDLQKDDTASVAKLYSRGQNRLTATIQIASLLSATGYPAVLAISRVTSLDTEPPNIR